MAVLVHRRRCYCWLTILLLLVLLLLTDIPPLSVLASTERSCCRGEATLRDRCSILQAVSQHSLLRHSPDRLGLYFV